MGANKPTYVYMHTFPDGKVYIGIADDPRERWSYGHGYCENARMHAAIKLYGWNNIEHTIIAKCMTRAEAEQLEREYIILYDSENPEKGYNRTSIKAELLSRVAAGPKTIGRKPRQSAEMAATQEIIYDLLLFSGYIINGEGPECVEVKSANNQRHVVTFKGEPFGVYRYKTGELELSRPPIIPLADPRLNCPIVVRAPLFGWEADQETKEEIRRIKVEQVTQTIAR